MTFSQRLWCINRRFGAAGVDRFLNEYDIGGVSWVSTDDNLVLEYSTPRANVNDGEKTFKANRTLLVGFR